VLTLALPKRVLRNKAYAQKIAERLLGYLLDMEKHLGAGRLFLS
jgi:hypothetical protein